MRAGLGVALVGLVACVGCGLEPEEKAPGQTTDERKRIMAKHHRYLIRLCLNESDIALIDDGKVLDSLQNLKKTITEKKVFVDPDLMTRIEYHIKSLAESASEERKQERPPWFKMIDSIREPGGKVVSSDLHLYNTKITDDGLKLLKGLTELEYLDLGRTRVTDAGLVNLKGLRNLQWLDLRLTPITDAGLEHLKDLPRLKSLCLDYTEVTDTGLEKMKGVVSLLYLSIFGTGITDAGVRKLQQALPLCRIYKFP